MAKAPSTDRTSRTPGPQARGSNTSGEIAEFLKRAKAIARPADGARGRLLFALDATMSRQPTWDLACGLQAEMFDAVAETGGLDVQLIYFRGHGECRASKWVSDAKALGRLMGGIDCRGGYTQIGKVFTHARNEHKKGRINAIVYVGDSIEEDVDHLAHRAGELGLLGCPIFLFQEGRKPEVEAAFREFARLTKGAFARFDASAPRELADLLRAVAAYASGGRDTLRLQGTAPARALLAQLE